MKRAISPSPKPEPASKRSRTKPPTFAVVHKTLGEGQLTGLRLGESGVWLADVKFNGERRTLQLREEHWATAISDILDLWAYFPAPKPQKATPRITRWPAHDGESAGDTEDSVLDSGDAAEKEFE